MHVASEYIRSWVLLPLTSTAGRTSRVILADVNPWINIASLALHIARAMSRSIWSLEAVLHCRVRLLWLKHRNVSLSSLRVDLRHHFSDWSTCIDVARTLCTHYIDDLLPYAPLAATGDVVKCFINPDDMSRAKLADEHLAPVIKALTEEKPLSTNSAPELRKAFIRNGLLCRNFQLFSSSTACDHLFWIFW
jgi:hypothetical protein